jgi:hypothetical protein
LEYDLQTTSIALSNTIGMRYHKDEDDDLVSQFIGGRMSRSTDGNADDTTPAILFNRYMTGHGQRDGQLNVEIDNRHATRSYTINYFDSLPYVACQYHLTHHDTMLIGHVCVSLGARSIDGF